MWYDIYNYLKIICFYSAVNYAIRHWLFGPQELTVNKLTIHQLTTKSCLKLLLPLFAGRPIDHL